MAMSSSLGEYSNLPGRCQVIKYAWSISDERFRNRGSSSGRHFHTSLHSVLVTDLSKQCPIVEDLNRHKIDTNPRASSLTSKIFAVLFPGSPAVNALLATLYISGPPSQ